MTNTKKLVFLILSQLSIASQSFADCSAAKSAEAEKTASSLKSWDEVYNSYSKYLPCDDGAIGAGYSESISQLLANEWSHIDKLGKLTKNDNKFEKFVIKHIDETTSAEVNRKILKNSTENCPMHLKLLCSKISTEAKKNKF